MIIVKVALEVHDESAKMYSCDSVKPPRRLQSHLKCSEWVLKANVSGIGKDEDMASLNRLSIARY